MNDKVVLPAAVAQKEEAKTVVPKLKKASKPKPAAKKAASSWFPYTVATVVPKALSPLATGPPAQTLPKQANLSRRAS